MTSLWHGRATQRADEGMCNWLYQFRAWVLLAEFLLSDDENLGRDRGKEEPYRKYPLKYSSC